MQVERTGSVMWSLNITLLLPRLLWWPDTFYYFKHVETTVLSKQGPTCGCDHYRFTSAYSRRLCVSGAIILEPPIVQTQIRCRNITVGHNTKRVMVEKCGLILLGGPACWNTTQQMCGEVRQQCHLWLFGVLILMVTATIKAALRDKVAFHVSMMHLLHSAPWNWFNFFMFMLKCSINSDVTVTLTHLHPTESMCWEISQILCNVTKLHKCLMLYYYYLFTRPVLQGSLGLFPSESKE